VRVCIRVAGWGDPRACVFFAHACVCISVCTVQCKCTSILQYLTFRKQIDNGSGTVYLSESRQIFPGGRPPFYDMRCFLSLFSPGGQRARCHSRAINVSTPVMPPMILSSVEQFSASGAGAGPGANASSGEGMLSTSSTSASSSVSGSPSADSGGVVGGREAWDGLPREGSRCAAIMVLGGGTKATVAKRRRSVRSMMPTVVIKVAIKNVLPTLRVTFSTFCFPFPQNPSIIFCRSLFSWAKQRRGRRRDGAETR